MITQGLKKIIEQIQANTHHTVALPCPQLHALWQGGLVTSISSIPCSLALSPWPFLVSRTEHRPCHLSGPCTPWIITKMQLWRRSDHIHVYAVPVMASPAQHSSLTFAQLLFTSQRPSHTFSNVSSRGKGKEIVCKYLYLYPAELSLTFYYIFLTIYHSTLLLIYQLIFLEGRLETGFFCNSLGCLELTL